MKLSEQCCTIEQAKRLKELGVAQDSLFYKHLNLSDHTLYVKNRNHVWHAVYADFFEHDVRLIDYMYSAFTVAELGVMLPPGCQSAYNDHHDYWVCEYVEPWDEEDEPDAKPYSVEGWKLTATTGDEEYETEAQTRAAMLIHLLENGHTTAAEVNQRLNPQTATA